MEDNFDLIQIKSFSPEGINFFPARSQKQKIFLKVSAQVNIC